MIVEKNKMAKNFLITSICLPILIIVCLSIPMLLPPLHFSVPNVQLKYLTENTILQGFSTIFLSIVLEAFPFIMIGTILSSIIQIFVTEETLSRIIPKNKIFGVLCAALIGLVIPICDCAIVPVVRRLIKKGMPLHIGITFMLSVPIINPIVLVSTYYAFSNNIYIVIIRAGLGIVGAMVIGSIIGFMNDKNYILKNNEKIDMYVEHQHDHNHGNEPKYGYHHDHNHEDESECQCACGHVHHRQEERHNIKSIIMDIMDHTTIELHDVGKFIIIGSFLSALMQTFIPRKYILLVGHDRIYSILIMICFAFLLAVCSETDAFIARTFVGQFTTGSIIAFLIFGPMMDVKNALMLSGTFKTKFILRLIFVIFVVCFIIGSLINFLTLKGGIVL